MTKKQMRDLRPGNRVSYECPGAEDHGVTGTVKIKETGFYIQWSDGEFISIMPDYVVNGLAPYLKLLKE